RGVLENLTLRPQNRRRPGAGEIEIEVRASGLNFRDVLNALGMYPGDAGPLGSECAGVVTAVGEGVSHLRPGDEVIAITTRGFSTYTIANALLAVRKPAGLTFTEAATIPIAFLTAAYALNHLAQLRAGERVLIHAAAGGVGMAAVQLARLAGAEIFGTAGSPEKRELLTTLGVAHTFNSRTLDFAAEIMALTGGEGVDVVLNSLTGDFIPHSLSLLRENGRFIEIGKIGVWEDAQVAQHHRHIAYHVLYLGEVCDSRPELIQQMLQELVADFAAGRLAPLPQHTFPLTQA